MPPRRRLSDADRGRALAWIQDGIALREIGRRLGVTHSVIQRLQIDGKLLEMFKNRADLVTPDPQQDNRIGLWFCRVLETEQRLPEHPKMSFNAKTSP